MLLLINAFQAFDEFYNLLVQPRRRHLPAVRPPAARLPLLRRPRAPAGLRPRQRRGRDPHVVHRRVHARSRVASRLREAGVLWLRSDRPAARAAQSPRSRVRRADRRGGAVPRPVLPRRPQRAVDRPRDLGAGLEAVPDVVALGQRHRRCSTTARCRSCAACATRRSCRCCRPPAPCSSPRWPATGWPASRTASPNAVFVVDPRHADDPGRRDVRAELRHRVARSAGSNTLPGADRAGHVPGVRRLPVPSVLPRLPARAGGGGAHRRPVDVGDVLAHRRAQLQGHLRRRRLDHVHRQLERLPVAARRRQATATSGPCRWRCRRSSTRRARR